jgi:hypothetical protein
MFIGYKSYSPVSVKWIPEDISSKVKRPHREADQSYLPAGNLRNAWRQSSTPPYTFTSWRLIKHLHTLLTFSALLLNIFWFMAFGFQRQGTECTEFAVAGSRQPSVFNCGVEEINGHVMEWGDLHLIESVQKKNCTITPACTKSCTHRIYLISCRFISFLVCFEQQREYYKLNVLRIFVPWPI